MNSKAERKEAIKAFKERKTARGIFAMRCTATARVWVGSSLNLDATRNSLQFALSHGSHHDKTLQSEWNAQGEPAFQYEILETLDDDVSPLAVHDLLKETKRGWIAKFGARPLL